MVLQREIDGALCAAFVEQVVSGDSVKSRQTNDTLLQEITGITSAETDNDLFGWVNPRHRVTVHDGNGPLNGPITAA
eukprot:g70213.t1